MFTGLVESVGTVVSVAKNEGGQLTRVQDALMCSDVSIDDSISIDGACHTVVAFGDDWFDVQSIPETLRKTTMGQLDAGSVVNLERAIGSGRFGGHFVQGHVDTTGIVQELQLDGESLLFSVSFPREHQQLVVETGSVTLAGVSLTVARLHENILTVALIPHTLSQTTLSNYRVGDTINIEFDMIGKYIVKSLKAYQGKS